MKIRTVTKNDLAAIVAIEQAGFTAEEAGSQATFAHRIKNFPETFLVAVAANEEVVGFVCGPLTTSFYIADWMYEKDTTSQALGKYLNILSIAVKPANRGQGIGSALLMAIEKVAKKQGASACSLTCLKEKIPFYERNGYQNQGQSDSQHAGEVWYNLVKSLL